MIKNTLFYLPLLICMLTSCDQFKCHKCIGDERDVSLPAYAKNATITFNSDSGNTATFRPLLFNNPPPENYCGPLGSGSFYACDGDESVALNSTIDGNELARFGWSISRGPDVSFHKYFSVKNFNATQTTDKLNTLKINATTYTDVFYYKNTKPAIGDCVEFYYNVKNGLIEYSIKNTSGVETWTLVQ